jgi:hypothetical protein
MHFVASLCTFLTVLNLDVPTDFYRVQLHASPWVPCMQDAGKGLKASFGCCAACTALPCMHHYREQSRGGW